MFHEMNRLGKFSNSMVDLAHIVCILAIAIDAVSRIGVNKKARRFLVGEITLRSTFEFLLRKM